MHAVMKEKCFSCHGEKKQKGKLRLDTVSMTPQSATDLAVWRRVLEQILDEEMPPEDEDQFTKAERDKTLTWLEGTLKAHADLNLTPSAGNYVDHDALFSGEPAGDPGTPARVWRLAPQAYKAFMYRLNKELQLNVDMRKIMAPWAGSNYSTAGRIDEAEIEAHLRTCALMLSRMMPLVKNNKFRVRSLHPVYKAGKTATAPQIQAAVKDICQKILRQAPNATEMQEYSQLLTNDLKTYEPSTAIERFLTKVLFHPSVLYRVETPIAGSQRSIMPPRQLARAIAYSLTYSEPDEGLRKAVAAGKLSTKEDVRREVERLVTATTPYGQEVSLTADQRAKLDALNREYWQIKTPEARKKADYNQKLGKFLGKQAGRWIQLQRAGYRSTDGEQVNVTSLLRPQVMSFFQKYFGYRKSPFKCDVTLKELNVLKSGNAGWTANWFGNDTDSLVAWVLESDKEVLRTLLTTRKTFVIARHTEHAGQGFQRHVNQIKEMLKWKHFQTALQTYEISLTQEQWLLGKEEPVDMPKGRRMGILTHPSWLVAQSGNFDNDAIHRGKWIHEKLLGGRIPDVPITVDAKLPDEPHNTLRERMRVTRVEQCIKCHNRMDALGLAFEQFDHFGRYRSAEIVVDKEKTAQMKKRSPDTPRIMTTKPFETTGRIAYSGDPKLDGPVKDVFELIEKLAHSERVEQVFVRHVFRYFMGRNETLADGPTLVAAHKAYRENGGSFNALLVSLLTSDSFLYRTMPELPPANAASLRANEKIVLPAHLQKPGITNSLGMLLAYIPAGKFGMGSPRDEPHREAQEKRHEVQLTREFYVSVHEVTVGQFREFIRDSGHATEAEKDGKGGWGVNESGSLELNGKFTWETPGFQQSDNHPVVIVSWNDAKAFCRWLSIKEKKRYRLPTEAEWEYACRSGTRSAYANGNDPQRLMLVGNAGEGRSVKPEDGHRFTAPVGQYKPNAFGLYDMHGNVWEWCEDWYAPNSYASEKQTDPVGPASGKARVHRGGGWSSATHRCRSAARIGRHPSSYRGSYLGFRVVLE
jgi:formylglycine-generating enzyme required for sulfatase activity